MERNKHKRNQTIVPALILCVSRASCSYLANQDGRTSVSSKHFSKCGAALAFVLSDYSARTVK